MGRNVVRGVLVMAMVLAGNVLPASADWRLTPYAGIVFGQNADLGADDSGTYKPRVSVGGSFAWIGDGALGFEVDFATMPNFYNGNTVAGAITDSRVTSLMFNMIFGGVGRQYMPYVAAGAGWIGSTAEGSGQLASSGPLKAKGFGMGVGGGLNIGMTDDTTLRIDIRNFRSLVKRDTRFGLGIVGYWRLTGGVTFIFG